MTAVATSTQTVVLTEDGSVLVFNPTHDTLDATVYAHHEFDSGFDHGVVMVSMSQHDEDSHFSSEFAGQVWCVSAKGMLYCCEYGIALGCSQADFGFSNAVMVSVGIDHMLLLTADGCVWSKGRGEHGALGLGSHENARQLALVRFDAGEHESPRIVMVAAGCSYSAALTEEGLLWTWGTNTFGCLGLGDDRHRLIPTLLPAQAMGDTKIVLVAAGCKNTTVVVTVDGELWGWGNTTPLRASSGERLSPLLLGGAADFGGSPVLAAACGGERTIVVTQEGVLWSLGGVDIDWHGGSAGAARRAPTRLECADADGAAPRFVSVGAARATSSAVTEDGRLYVWGVVADATHAALRRADFDDEREKYDSSKRLNDLAHEASFVVNEEALEAEAEDRERAKRPSAREYIVFGATESAEEYGKVGGGGSAEEYGKVGGGGSAEEYGKVGGGGSAEEYGKVGGGGSAEEYGKVGGGGSAEDERERMAAEDAEAIAREMENANADDYEEAYAMQEAREYGKQVERSEAAEACNALRSEQRQRDDDRCDLAELRQRGMHAAPLAQPVLFAAAELRYTRVGPCHHSRLTKSEAVTFAMGTHMRLGVDCVYAPISGEMVRIVVSTAGALWPPGPAGEWTGVVRLLGGGRMDPEFVQGLLTMRRNVEAARLGSAARSRAIPQP